MLEAFPELTKVCGFYYCSGWGERTHWWLVDPDENVVDPTAAQFPSGGRGHYERIDDPADIPTGICMDCGDHVYRGDTFCSPECEAATRVYLQTGIL